MVAHKELKPEFGLLGENSIELLKCSIASMLLKTPILTASGTFGYGYNYTNLKNFPTDVIGGIVLKSVTLKPKEGNPPPRFVETPGGLINSIGIQNVGIEKLISEELPKLRKIKTNIIVSIAGSYVEEYSEVSSYLNGNNDFEAIEVNISCPNVKEGGMLFSFDSKLAAIITEAVKKQIQKKPVIMKLSPNSPDIVATALACINAGADALALTNTFIALAIDVEKKRPILKRNFGGLSGPTIKPLTLAIVAKVAKEFKEKGIEIPIIGIGGIQTAQDVLEYIIAGASAVEIGTSIFYEPMVFRTIFLGLKKYCQKHNVSISEIVGTLRMYD